MSFTHLLLRASLAGLALGSAAPSAEEGRPTVETVAAGSMSAASGPRQAVARTDAEWEALWKAHDAQQAKPPVDLKTRMIVAVFLGSRPTAGYGVQITGARRDGSVLVVEYAERTPPPGAITAQVLTSPFHIGAVPRHEGSVRFEKVREAR
jgi:hypothetical protein